MTSKGEQIAFPAALRGSERSWLTLYGGSASNPSVYYNLSGDWFRYFNFQPNPGPKWKPEDFDFDLDYKRLGMAENSDAINQIDLSRFKARGGKLLMSTGWSAAVEEVLGTVDYYEKVEKIMGGQAQTQDFFRLFMVPGVDHGGGGEGAHAVDYLSYLEAWVEKGQAPDHLIGFHVKDLDPDEAYFPITFPLDPARIDFARPIYPYPTKTRYRGHGDPKDAASFGPVRH
jgi:feruloyl esterase